MEQEKRMLHSANGEGNRARDGIKMCQRTERKQRMKTGGTQTESFECLLACGVTWRQKEFKTGLLSGTSRKCNGFI